MAQPQWLSWMSSCAPQGCRFDAWVGTCLGGRSDPSQGTHGRHIGVPLLPSLSGACRGAPAHLLSHAGRVSEGSPAPARCAQGTRSPGGQGVQPQPGSQCATALTETTLSVCPAWWDPGQPSSRAASVYLGQAPVSRTCTWGVGRQGRCPLPTQHGLGNHRRGKCSFLSPGCQADPAAGMVAGPPSGRAAAGRGPLTSSVAPSWLFRACPWPLVPSPHFQMFGRAAPPWPQAGWRALLGERCWGAAVPVAP